MVSINVDLYAQAFSYTIINKCIHFAVVAVV